MILIFASPLHSSLHIHVCTFTVQCTPYIGQSSDQCIVHVRTIYIAFCTPYDVHHTLRRTLYCDYRTLCAIHRILYTVYAVHVYNTAYSLRTTSPYTDSCPDIPTTHLRSMCICFEKRLILKGTAGGVSAIVVRYYYSAYRYL